MRLTEEHFKALVADALDDLPENFACRMDNVEVVVDDVPPPELAGKGENLVLGLYHGVPLSQRSTMAPLFPDIIYIYKRNIERICDTEAEIRRQVRKTVMHEIGHHFGLNERELRRSGV